MVVRTYAELDLATLLAENPLTAEELSAKTDTDPIALTLLLRAAEDMGLHVRDVDTEKLSLTDTGRLLSSTTDGNLRAAAILNGADYRYEPWGQLPAFVRTGSGKGLSPTWENGSLPYLAERPEQLAIFQEAMSDLSRNSLKGEDENEEIAQAINFSEHPKIIDIGGGTGSLLQAIGRHHPNCELTLFDLSEVLQQTSESDPSANHIHHLSGNFLKEISVGYSAYLFKNVLHNHQPEPLHQILSHLAQALQKSPRNARAYFCELLRDDTKAGRGRNSLTDLNLNLLVGGRIRSKEEYEELLKEHGLRISTLISLSSSHRKILIIAKEEDR